MGFTSSPPPLFFMNSSVLEAGGFVSIAVETALVMAVTSTGVLAAVGGWGAETWGPVSVTRYSSKSSSERTVQSLVVLSPQHCQKPLRDRIHFLRAFGITTGSVLPDLVSTILSNSFLVRLE